MRKGTLEGSEEGKEREKCNYIIISKEGNEKLKTGLSQNVPYVFYHFSLAFFGTKQLTHG